MIHESKEELFERGKLLAESFCAENNITTPEIQNFPRLSWRVSACTYYRNGKINVCSDLCANVGISGRHWSYPGYTVDRTPFGATQHELGHHVDRMMGGNKKPYWSEYSLNVFQDSREKPISGYCPNEAEWFAEIFRLFITNPDLLKILRPRTYSRLLSDGFSPIVDKPWRRVLRNAPTRTLNVIEKKIKREGKGVSLI